MFLFAFHFQTQPNDTLSLSAYAESAPYLSPWLLLAIKHSFRAKLWRRCLPLLVLCAKLNRDGTAVAARSSAKHLKALRYDSTRSSYFDENIYDGSRIFPSRPTAQFPPSRKTEPPRCPREIQTHFVTEKKASQFLSGQQTQCCSDSLSFRQSRRSLGILTLGENQLIIQNPPSQQGAGNPDAYAQNH